MAERRDAVMPPASGRGGRRRLVTGLVVAVAALAGAAVVVAVWPSDRSADPVPVPSGTATATATASASGQAAVSGCTGGANPAEAVQAAMRAPATPDGAAEAAAAAFRFTNSKAFGEADAPEVIAKVADRSGAGQWVALQKGQAQYLNRMTVSVAHTGRGAFAVTREPLSPVVTVLAPVEWSTGGAQHLDWSLYDVRLLRDGDRWTVIGVQSTLTTPDELRPIRGQDARQVSLDQVGPALSALGFRRYSGDC
jgi:hypothetical protein